MRMSTADESVVDRDDELMRLLQQGQESAFQELMDRHLEDLRNFFRARSHSLRARQVAEDLAQEVLLRVYHQAPDFKPQGKFKSWMYRIARNLLIDALRRDAYDALTGAREGGDVDEQLTRLVDEVPEVAQLAGQKVLGDLVVQLLTELPEEQRLTFQIHHFLGLSLPEVAEILETSTATTKSRLRLAREKLRELLAARGITEQEMQE